MNSITIQLPDDRMKALHQLAQQAKVRPEDLLEAGVEEWLRDSEQEFLKAAQYVLKKNEELYRRLA